MTIPQTEIAKPASDELWELWCLKIFAKKYGIAGLQRYRTSGFPQEGVDLIGTRADAKIVGIQCKLRSAEKELTVKEAESDLEKWQKSGLNLGAFVIACTHSSTALQKWAKSKSEPDFEVTFYAWPDIVNILRLDKALSDELTDGKRISDARDELVYTRALIDLRDRMNLYALEKAATEVREPPLTAAYVSLDLSEVTRDGKDSERVGGSYSIEQVMDTLQAAKWSPTDADARAEDELSLEPLGGSKTQRTFRRSNVLVLVGEAGRGKTTLLRYIAVQAAKARLTALQSIAPLPEYRTTERSLPWLERVPFYREVRLATAARPIEDLDHLASEILPSTPACVAHDWARSVVAAGRALILLDGVDEVPDGQQRTALLANIRTLVQQNPQTLFVISSRPGAADGLRRELAILTPREARVQALAGEKLRDFISHWHKAVSSVANTLYTGNGKANRIREIADAEGALPAKLDAARHIKSLMATPLLAALVCAYHLDHKSLPDDQTELMTNLAYCLIDFHDRQRPGMPVWPAYSELAKGDKLRILGFVAADMVRRLSPTIVCDSDTDGGTQAFDTHICEFIKTAPWFNGSHVGQLRDGLCQRSGVLHELQRGVLSFIHNEFRDFLAARAMAPQADSPEVYQTILTTLKDQDWHGLIFFVITADRDKQRPGVADRLVTSLLEIVNNPPTALLSKLVKTMEEKQEADTYLSLRRVAFRLAGAKPPVTTKTYDALRTVRGSMLPPTTYEDAEIVSELGTNAIGDLLFDPSRSPRVRAMSAYALRLIDHEAARAASHVYAQKETDWDVLDELAQSIPVAEIAHVSHGLTRNPVDFELSSQIEYHLVRQAAGLLGDVKPGPALALLRRAKRFTIKTESEATGIFSQPQRECEPFAASVVLLDGTAGSPEGIAAIAHAGAYLLSLRTLNIVDGEITSAAARALANPKVGIRSLAVLGLFNTHITDSGLAAFAAPGSALASLSALELLGTGASDTGLAAIAVQGSSLARLAELYLFSGGFTDVGVKALAAKDTGLGALSALDLRYNKLGDESALALADPRTGLGALTRLNLADTQVSDIGLKALAHHATGLKMLTQLVVSRTKISDDGLRSLSSADTGLKTLLYLDLGDTKVGDRGLEFLAAKTTGLRQLGGLSLCGTEITSEGVKVLAAESTGLSSLCTLNLIETHIDDVAALALAAPGTGLTALSRLYLDHTQVGDAGAVALAARTTGLQRLTRLSLKRTKITDEGASALAAAGSGLTSLAVLDLSKTQVTAACVERIRQSRPGLEVLYI